MMRRFSFGLLLLLAACDRPAPGEEAIDAGNPLEIAARERGIVRPEAADLTGAFERRHDLGRDAMCVVPDGKSTWRFALTASFGDGLSCEARGHATRDGGGWRFDFAGVEGCSVLAGEQEDELRLPGDLPPQCDSLCPGRASLSGLRLPRASWAEADAKGLRMKGDDGNMTRPCGA
ncbi:MAG TPA: hypothetical protein PKD99_09890 [Sphingopyxis sp.]|nr:hypothetical protein [Sphingopyxis sp.]HMP45404.1 hypothetical protein [Sphingopyxis sp.]HMQ17812.1 hypothetical protein [Sphingopyxis sp.]